MHVVACLYFSYKKESILYILFCDFLFTLIVINFFPCHLISSAGSFFKCGILAYISIEWMNQQQLYLSPVVMCIHSIPGLAIISHSLYISSPGRADCF